MYENPTSLIIGSAVMWLTAMLFVGLRFGNRIRERQGFFASDWLVLAGWVLGTGITILEIYGVSIKALGYRLGSDPTSAIERLEKTSYLQLAYIFLGMAALGLIKLSVCFLYWHLFAQVVLRRFLIVWMVVIGGWTVTFIVAGLLQCGTHFMTVFGTPAERSKYCQSSHPGGLAMVGSDIATDFITLIIPAPVVLRLQMDMRRRLLIVMTFLIGALTVAASVTKGYIYTRLHIIVTTDSEDALLLITGFSIWNLAEVEIGIVAACGPLLQPILARVIASVRSLFISKEPSISTQSILEPKHSHGVSSFARTPESESQQYLPVIPSSSWGRTEW